MPSAFSTRPVGGDNVWTDGEVCSHQLAVDVDLRMHAADTFQRTSRKNGHGHAYGMEFFSREMKR